MSSVTYKEACDNPKTLVGFASNAKYMEENVQVGDMLYNEKTKQLLMLFIYKENDFYLMDITNKCFFSEGDVWTKGNRKRKDFVEKHKEKFKDFVYAPANRINSVNLDVEMK